MHHHVEVVVVGAGLAGLACARELSRREIGVIVCEARDRVGGRVDSVLIDGERVELGGQFAGPGQDRVHALAAELGVPVFRTHTAGVHLVEHESGRTGRFRGVVPRLSPAAMLDFAQAEARFERLARTVDPEVPWRGPAADRLDGVTLESWIRRTLLTPAGRRLFALATRLLWACEPAELSLLHALFYVRAAGGLRAVMATDGGAQQDMLDGGAHLLAVRMARDLGDRVRLGMPIRRIAQDDAGVVVTAASGVSVRADQVVVAVPPTLAGRIVHEPALPAARDALTQRLAMGSTIKCMIVYAAPFWRDAGLSGHALSLRGPLAAVADSGSPAGRHGVLAGVLEGAVARRLAGRSAEERRGLVLDELVRLFGPAAARPVAYVERDWNSEEYTRGAYAALFPPGAWTAYGPALRAPAGRVHWAGAETATRWYGYMDGAIRSGEDAAAAVAPRVTGGRTPVSG
ncbi:monoamine oxidase [Actinoplanes italicus]|uniref:Monoamine oxidase n=1 Tax=Actinoplanes italicus TaxID=113567 RepID=A0A2T0K0Z0_9ACTN|nr:monoamine oxidase [Actinoplanes italicus]